MRQSRVRHFFTLYAFLGFLFTTHDCFSASYKIDPDHSTVSFKIRHLFSNVVGNFTQFDGAIEYEPGKPETWSARSTIQAASINTNVSKRDKHLQSADFFDVEKFPTLEFKSTGVTDATAETAKLHGNLKIHGVEKPVVLDLEIHGAGKDPWGNTRAGFTAKTRIDRKDFGLIWNQTLETGGLLVGDDVDLTLEVEGIAKP